MFINTKTLMSMKQQLYVCCWLKLLAFCIILGSVSFMTTKKIVCRQDYPIFYSRCINFMLIKENLILFLILNGILPENKKEDNNKADAVCFCIYVCRAFLWYLIKDSLGVIHAWHLVEEGAYTTMCISYT